MGIAPPECGGESSDGGLGSMVGKDVYIYTDKSVYANQWLSAHDAVCGANYAEVTKSGSDPYAAALQVSLYCGISKNKTQKWRLEDAGGGFYFIRLMANTIGKCGQPMYLTRKIDALTGSTYNHTGPFLMPKRYGQLDYQRFAIEKSMSTNAYRIKCKKTGEYLGWNQTGQGEDGVNTNAEWTKRLFWHTGNSNDFWEIRTVGYEKLRASKC